MTTTTQIAGSITRKSLETWLEVNRPDLELYEDGNGKRGFYRKDLGPAASFHACGTTWRHVAEELGAVEPKYQG